MMKTCVEGWQDKTRDSIPNMSPIGTIRPKEYVRMPVDLAFQLLVLLGRLFFHPSLVQMKKLSFCSLLYRKLL